MNPLERRLIMISRLTTKGDQLFSARPHVPLIIKRDPAGEGSNRADMASEWWTWRGCGTT
jgi:hypothetical protein